jgi:glutamate synthase (NADPH/NADH) large chain
MAELGFKTMQEMTGHSERLEKSDAINHWKSQGLDFSKLLATPDAGPGVAIFNCEKQDHGLEKALDNDLIKQSKNAIENGIPLTIESDIINVNRSVGAMLSGRIAERHGFAGLEEDTIHVKLTGTAGQSLGAWLSRGVTIELAGDSNDYVGKGLSGGKIIIYPSPESSLTPEDNIIVGNTVLYGAIAGECYLRGIAGERFAVRNSGATAVVEGVGDHGCEYMTGGCVVVLGSTGRNFAAGMSGGIAYILDEDRSFDKRCNMAQVELERISDSGVSVSDQEMADMNNHDAQRLRGLIEKHLEYTGSSRAKSIIDDWNNVLPNFVKIMPTDYRRALLEMQAKANEQGYANMAVGAE